MNESDSFSILSSDVPIFGRERESMVLEDVYKKSMNHGQIVWIYGASGVGKSALMQDFFNYKKNVCTGKFGRIHSSIPYSGIVRVLTDLCSILENMLPPVILGPEFVSILTKLVPQITNVTTYDEIERKTGSQRRLSLSNKVGEWGFEKLKQAIRSFMKGAINVISSYSKLPVILHFDDLQWADEASLELITAFLEMKNIINGFMFVGSYRDNELESDSPFSICQKTILQFSKFHCTDISLANLTLNDVANLISNVSQMSKSKSEELARLVYDITRGNSLFVRRYLHHMLQKNLIRQCDDSKCWEYDDVQIRSKIDVVEDIDSFLVEEMRNLPITSLEAIKLASLLGPEVEISLLESILQDLEVDLSKDTIHDILECLESRCYIDMEDDHYKVFHFVHDRILRAAHCLVTEELRQVLHLRMGRAILKQYEESQESKPSHLLLAIDQLNRGKDLIESMTDKEELATLNLHAAHEMIALSAFNLAKSHLLIALDLLGKDCWETHYNLTLSINNLLASVLSGNGSMLECLDLIDTISVKCMYPRDGYLTQAIRLEILACINRLEECLNVSMTMLAELEHPKIPTNPGFTSILPAILGVKKLLKPLSGDDILNLPLCSDCRIQHAMRILSIMCPVAFFAAKDSMIPVIVCRMMQLTLRHGLTELSPYALASFGYSIALSGDFDEGFRFGSLALQMMERFGEDARTLVMVYGLFFHIKRPVLDTLKHTLRAYYVAFAQGDMAFSGQAIATHLIARMVAGSSLTNIIDDTFSFCDQLKAYNQTMMWNVLVILQRGNLELADRSDEIQKLTGEVYDDDSFHSYLLGFHVDYFQFQLSLFTLRCRFILNDEKATLIHAERFWNFKGLHNPFCYSVFYFLFSALVAIDCWKTAGVTQRFRYWRLFRKFQRLLVAWTKKGDPNTLHLVYLLDAEVLTTKKNVSSMDIQQIYHQSIAQARRSGFIQDAALANERLGEYFLSVQDRDWAQYYLRNAKMLYYDWGAKRKVQLMEQKYGSLVEIKVTEADRSKSIVGRARNEIVSDIEGVRARTRVSIRENRVGSLTA